ncbi:ribosome maturation factor RimP [Candidatus Fokinia crypta]|uniref:Ribosome maturation factor RimP n=1 Tax=Candidatus Fokinia crypta TaxID=1920990 RepID=A0ABZ0UN83_9RICK|nr:hypothetical protein [Candidatus Fokinia cryptica]WPX97581.1 Ribosome maturation factor RimP [Candidatus Fokinia cryptica]
MQYNAIFKLKSEETIFNILSDTLLTMNYEIVRVKIVHNAQVEILIEKTTGETVSVDETAKVARYIKPLLYQGNAILNNDQNFSPMEYSYDISSCGIEKPLTRQKDLLNSINKIVSIKLYRKITDKNGLKFKKLEGELVKLIDTGVVIQHNSEEISISFDNISEITLVYVPWRVKNHSSRKIKKK